jgi:hypothetical protein
MRNLFGDEGEVGVLKLIRFAEYWVERLLMPINIDSILRNGKAHDVAHPKARIAFLVCII